MQASEGVKKRAKLPFNQIIIFIIIMMAQFLITGSAILDRVKFDIKFQAEYSSPR